MGLVAATAVLIGVIALLGRCQLRKKQRQTGYRKQIAVHLILSANCAPPNQTYGNLFGSFLVPGSGEPNLSIRFTRGSGSARQSGDQVGAFPKGVETMKNTVLKTTLKATLAAGALLAAAAVPASAQGWGFGFSTGNGYDRYSGYYSDYGRGHGDRYRSGYYNRPYYGGYGYGGYSWRHHRGWDDDGWRHRSWRHRWHDDY